MYYFSSMSNLLNRKFKYTFSNATVILVIINALVYFLTDVIGISISSVPIKMYLSMMPAAVRHGWIWQIFTYMFVHGNFTHLFFNMFGLLMFGLIIEKSIGTREFLLFYFLSGIISGLISYIIYALTGQWVVFLVGASGAIYALLFLYAVLFPTSRIMMFFLIPMKAPFAVLLFMGIELFSQLTGSSGGVAHLTHLAGIFAAWMYCLVRFKINPIKVWKNYL